LTIRVDVRDAADPTAAVVDAIHQRTATADADGGLSETVVRVVVRLRQEQESLLLEREIKQALENAYFVAALQKEVEHSNRQRLGGVTVEALTPVELLGQYLEIKETPKERAGLLLQRGETLIRAVDEEGESG
jgi:hypothetical protein